MALVPLRVSRKPKLLQKERENVFADGFEMTQLN